MASAYGCMEFSVVLERLSKKQLRQLSLPQELELKNEFEILSDLVNLIEREHNYCRRTYGA